MRTAIGMAEDYLGCRREKTCGTGLKLAALAINDFLVDVC